MPDIDAPASAYEPWLRMRLTDGLTHLRLIELIRAYGSPDVLLGLTVDRIVQETGIQPTLAEALLRGPDEDALKREIEAIETHGVRLAAWTDEHYPVNLHDAANPPALIYYRGTLEPDDRFAVAVVGTRRYTQYGRLAVERIVGRLAGAGLNIVSGLALGIDALAHDAALEAGGRTYAVLGNGLSHCFPQQNEALMLRVIESGAVFSEYPMDTVGYAGNFPVRNRIIAGLALGALIIEAPEKSGALHTARHAVEDNRDVFAIPADISRRNSLGCNRLLQQGAKLVIEAEDVLSELAPQLRDYLQQEQRRQAEETVAALDGLEAAIHAALAEEPVHIDALLQKLQAGDGQSGETERPALNISQLSAALFQLELKDLVRQLPGQIYALRV
ncbi:DNA-processing protein DprA [Candidatus Sumerlaeota bacterium]|nr:DNA-processing protein DprA [Candidatus Sumerlaeota bacterium]